jgi:hypothetical protein
MTSKPDSKQSKTPSAAKRAEATPASEAAKRTIHLAQANNQEFMIFRDRKGKDWAFPRAHMVSAKMTDKQVCELNFRTHQVRFASQSYDAVMRGLLEGDITVLISAPLTFEGLHIRSVFNLKVEVVKIQQGKPES